MKLLIGVILVLLVSGLKAQVNPVYLGQFLYADSLSVMQQNIALRRIVIQLNTAMITLAALNKTKDSLQTAINKKQDSIITSQTKQIAAIQKKQKSDSTVLAANKIVPDSLTGALPLKVVKVTTKPHTFQLVIDKVYLDLIAKMQADVDKLKANAAAKNAAKNF